MQKVKSDKCKSIKIVVDKKICCGCGACYVACPTKCITFTYGNRYNYPKINPDACNNCGNCQKVCPSKFLTNGIDPGYTTETNPKNLGCHLVYSPDDSIRLDASSGGGITALIWHLIQKGKVDGGIVARNGTNNPLKAETFIARSREELLSARASKYAPVSSCVTLAEVLEKPGKYVFVGTPCMIEGLCKLQKFLPKLEERIVLTIGLVCAGMASHLSTLAYLLRYKVDPSKVRRFAYRGGGWPGGVRAWGENNELLLDRPLLGDSLVHLVGKDHYLRCWNCLDHFGRLADIVVSDPWTEDIVKNETKGKSAFMLQTQRGTEALQSAIESNALIDEHITTEDMLDYNRHLVIHKKHARHSWMSLYQLLFFGRVVKPFSILGSVLRRNQVGLATTLKARFNRNFYEDETPLSKIQGQP